MLGHASVLSTWHVVLAAGGFLYSVPIVPSFKGGSFRLLRLKEVAALKNLTVSVLWGVPPFAIAGSLETASAPPVGDLLVVVAAFCPTTLINTTSCDVRDIESDSAFGITTLAVRLGKNTIGAVLLALGSLSCIVVAIAWQWGAVGAHATALFFVTLIWTGLVALPVYRSELRLPEWLGEPLIDAQQIACGLLLVLIASRIHVG